MAKDKWTDEETRYFFQLYADERRKGNRTSIGMNQTGKEFIIKKFEERFKKGFQKWNPFFKNRYDSCKKKYTTFRTLTHNRTGLGYDDMGKLDMSDDWWKERIEEWPGAKKFRGKLVANMDVYEEEFCVVVVTGAEGWSAQTGAASLGSRVDGDDDDEADSVDKDMLVEKQTQTQTQTQTQAGSSRAKRKRKEKDLVVEACVKRTEALEKKNRIAEQMLELEEREHASSIENVLETLNGLRLLFKLMPLPLPLPPASMERTALILCQATASFFFFLFSVQHLNCVIMFPVFIKL